MLEEGVLELGPAHPVQRLPRHAGLGTRQRIRPPRRSEFRLHLVEQSAEVVGPRLEEAP